MDHRSLGFLLTIAVTLGPQLAQAQPAQILASQSVAPLRQDIGDGLCITAVHVQDPALGQVPFSSIDDALGVLNRSARQLTEDGRASHLFSLINFKNNDPVAAGDFSGDALFPFSDNVGATPPGNDRNFAVRVRGYLNVAGAAPIELQRTIGLYADDGARLTIGGTRITTPDVDQRLFTRRIRQVQYSASGLYPVELTYFQDGSLAVLEFSESDQLIPENTKLTNLRDLGFTLVGQPRPNLFVNTELYSARTAGVRMCVECTSDSNCPNGNYCVKDWGPTPPEGLCQQCNVSDHCGPDCTTCGAGARLCNQGSCVQCLADTDCPADNRCDLDTHSCQLVVPNWQYLGGCSAVPASASGPQDAQSELGLVGVAGTLLLGLFLLHRHRRHSRRRAALLVLGLVALGPASARAELSGNVQTFHPALGPENIITVEGTRTGKPLRPMVNLLLEYSHRPLRIVDGDTGQILANTVPDLLTMHLMAGLGITRWLALGVDLPVVVYQGFDRNTPVQDVPNQPSSYGIGDFRLVSKFRLVNNTRGGFGLAFVPQVTFPTGDALQLRSDDAYGIEPRFALDYRSPGGAIIALNLGFLGRTSNQILRGMEVGSQVRYGLGMYVPLPEGFGLMGEVAGGTSVNNLIGGNIYSPLEGHVGGRWVHSSGVNVNLGTGLGFTQAVGSPQFRLFVSVGYLPVEKKPGVVVVPPAKGRLLAEKSGSGTGTVTSIPAGLDCGQRCSADFKLGTQVVLTAQASPDSHFIGWSGPCSGTGDCAVVMTGATRVGVEFARNEELRGTVTIQKEGEGLGLIASEPAGISCGKLCTASFRQDQELRLTAVPEKDSRFSGWEGPCTGLEPCTLVVRGDPHLKARFIKSQVVVTETKLDLQGHVVHFETAKAKVDIDSFHLLDEVVLIMKQNPKMYLRIEGHTDSVPFNAPGGNLQLSKDRAAAVVLYLVDHGIAGARLGSDGFGDTCPVASNLSVDGRQANRRTEFLVVDPQTGKYQRTPCVGYTPASVKQKANTQSSTPKKTAQPAAPRSPKPASSLSK